MVKRLIACLWVLMLTGCGGPSAPDAAPATAAPAKPEAAVQVATGAAAKIPDEFPKDVPLYPGFALTTVSALTGAKAYVVQGTTGDSLEKVASALRQQAAEQGWTEQKAAGASGDGNMAILNFEKSGRMLNFTLFREDTGTSINLTTGPR